MRECAKSVLCLYTPSNVIGYKEAKVENSWSFGGEVDSCNFYLFVQHLHRGIQMIDVWYCDFSYHFNDYEKHGYLESYENDEGPHMMNLKEFSESRLAEHYKPVVLTVEDPQN